MLYETKQKQMYSKTTFQDLKSKGQGVMCVYKCTICTQMNVHLHILYIQIIINLYRTFPSDFSVQSIHSELIFVPSFLSYYKY